MADTQSLLDDDEFLSDFVRFSAGILEEKFLRRKYHFFDERDWERLGADDRLAERIENRRLQKTRDGSLKRELAQKHIIRGVATLASIMEDPTANHRHVVDAIKTLDSLADPGPTHAPDSSERFVITINLGNDEKIKIDKAIGKVNPHAGEIIDHAPEELLAIVAANKRTDDGNGEPL